MHPSGLYYAFGGGTTTSSDQANSLSNAHRDAAIMARLFTLNETDFWGNLFPNMFNISDKTKFPPVFGSNHAAIFTMGPLKDDWTKPCPGDLTFEERSEKCISFQEVIYGTELLNRLEAIKKTVDPEFMFNCHKCVGNNIPKASQSQNDESAPATIPGTPSADEKSGASCVSTFAAAISAILFYYIV